MANPQRNALVLTVGTGNVEQLRETLLEPLTKSIRKGDWTHIVLLPSQVSENLALQLEKELAGMPIRIRPLPKEKAEDDADLCFAHFDNVLSDLRSEGYGPATILVDFTRGTKAMSAALVLAAVRHGLPRLRYIYGGQRDSRGMVVPGTEVVAEFRTAQVSARQRLDEARRFFCRGNFAAALEILPDPANPMAMHWPNEVLRLAGELRLLAMYFAAWDRFDYASAVGQSLPNIDKPGMATLAPTEMVRQWVAELAQPVPSEYAGRAERLRRLAAELLANGERRIRDHQYEEAVLRAYRLLEFLGEARLYDRNVDPQFERLNRNSVLDRLTNMRDPLARTLKSIAQSGEVRAADRHESILTHGYASVGGGDPTPLKQLYGQLQNLLYQDGGEKADNRLKLARTFPSSETVGTPLALLMPQ